MNKIDEAASFYGNAHIKNALKLDRDATSNEKCIPKFDAYDLETAFEIGAKIALSQQWVSVEDGLPKPKDYEYHLFPTMGDDRPTIFVCDTFLLNVAYNDGSGHDYCEANFEILPDGEFRWLYNDDYIEARIGNFKVAHWMPIPPLPEARKEDENAD